MHSSLGGEPVTIAWLNQFTCISPALWGALRTHKDIYVRCWAAMRSRDPAYLALFAKDLAPVLACAAGNTAAPYSILQLAIESADWAPRQQACGSEHLPDELLLQHYHSFGWLEFIVLVNKPQIPVEVLAHIYTTMVPEWHFDGKDEWKDWNYYIRNRARRRLGLPKVEGEEESSKTDPTK